MAKKVKCKCGHDTCRRYIEVLNYGLRIASRNEALKREPVYIFLDKRGIKTLISELENLLKEKE